MAATDDDREPHFALRLNAEDRALLDALAAHERLTRSDVIRRAIREAATRAGVKQPKVPTSKTRKK